MVLFSLSTLFENLHKSAALISQVTMVKSWGKLIFNGVAQKSIFLNCLRVDRASK